MSGIQKLTWTVWAKWSRSGLEAMSGNENRERGTNLSGKLLQERSSTVRLFTAWCWMNCPGFYFVGCVFRSSGPQAGCAIVRGVRIEWTNGAGKRINNTAQAKCSAGNGAARGQTHAPGTQDVQRAAVVDPATVAGRSATQWPDWN